MPRPRLGLLLGDPCGIGPEIAAKLLASPETSGRADILVLGDREVLAAGARVAKVSLASPEVERATDLKPDGGIALLHVPFAGKDAYRPGEVRPEAGAHALDLLRLAADAAARGELDAIVFAPLNKQAMMEGGLDFEDELRFLADHLACRTHVCELNTVDGLEFLVDKMNGTDDNQNFLQSMNA